ncbi:MAG: flagellar basal body rod protein FlgB [Proteobacteria bacterium]|nr:flagellar basal body rod protein FlgB [Pseudomonadota bacterium]MBU1686815.1 flagellar basal body rod protein FlgB [Pseudomonadota bacterium]
MEQLLFSGFLDVSSKALDIRSTRQGLIQSNIANIETPGYTVQDLPFRKVMETAMTRQGEMVLTHPGHIAPSALSGSNLQNSGEARPVDLEEEMVKLTENQLMYEIASRLTGKKFETMKYIIDEGGR